MDKPFHVMRFDTFSVNDWILHGKYTTKEIAFGVAKRVCRQYKSDSCVYKTGGFELLKLFSWDHKKETITEYKRIYTP